MVRKSWSAASKSGRHDCLPEHADQCRNRQEAGGMMMNLKQAASIATTKRLTKVSPVDLRTALGKLLRRGEVGLAAQVREELIRRSGRHLNPDDVIHRRES
jgi:hypothetical protein